MNVSELYDLTFWIKNNIIDIGLVAKYQALTTIVKQHTVPNSQKQSFEEQKNELISVLTNIPINDLTRDQIDFLNHLKIADTISTEGVDKVEDLLYRNVIDVATSATELQTIITNINYGIQKSQQIQEGLKDCAYDEEYETENEVLMRVSFTGNASMDHVTDFKKWGSTWYDIGRGVAMVHNAAPEDIKVVGATKGSIIVELAVNPEIAATVGGIIFGALKVAEKVLDIMKKAEELKKLQLDSKLIENIEKEAKAKKNEEIKEITFNIAGDLNISKSEGDKTSALESSVKKLVDFIEKGGIVDFIVPEDDEELDEDGINKNNELRLKFKEIRQLEKKLYLEDKSP